jgi:cobalt-zinc-cadmium efflux system protein
MAQDNNSHFSTGSKLKYGLFLSLIIFGAEVAGGLLSNSLALLGDAGHVLADIIALTLSWYAVRQADKQSNSRMTFGYHRIGVIVAIINAIAIFVIAGIILFEAYRRFQSPPEVKSTLMLAVAMIGLAVNLLVTFWLSKEQKRNINVRSAFWHAMGDALASVGVIIGGILILITGQRLIDPIVSVVISLIILSAAFSIFHEGFRVILEAVPKDVNVMSMITAIKKVKGVRNIHDVHVWSISPEIRAMNGHILIDDTSLSQANLIRSEIEKVVRDQFHVDHTTLQMECHGCSSDETFCHLNNICLPENEEKDSSK